MKRMYIYYRWKSGQFQPFLVPRGIGLAIIQRYPHLYTTYSPSMVSDEIDSD